MASLAPTRLVPALLLLVCLRTPNYAQVAVDHWTTDNGLPINTVSALCQTSEGYLWLATLDGLARFDGVRFTTFDRSNTPGIQGNRFSGMSCTKNGFWAATEGSGIIRYDQGRFHTYTVQDGLRSNSIDGISGDAGGNLWVLTLGCLSRWDPAGRRFVPLDCQAYRYSMAQGRDGRSIFYAVDESRLHLFVHGVESECARPAGWPLQRKILIGQDINRQVWFASGTGKLARLEGGRLTIFRRKQPRRLSSGDRQDGFASEYRDAHGKVWHIENQWDSAGGYSQSLSLPGNEPPKVEFSALFEDREGSIWLSTDGHGLYRLRAKTIEVASKEQGLPDRNVYPIYQSKDSTTWIGTWSGGLSRYKDGRFTTYTTADGLGSNRVGAIGEDSEGTLWVGVEGSLDRMQNGRFESVRVNGVSPDPLVRTIHQDRSDVLWFGSGAGLIRFEHGRWSLLTRKDGLATADIRVIIDARDGGLWAGGYGGLSRLRNGRVQAWTEKDGLASNTIRALYEDAEGVLWIGTYDGGLGRFENGRFTRYTVREGLFNNGVFQILEDSQGNLWMSCNRGIYRVSKRQLNDFAAGKTSTIRSIAYGTQDGLRSAECNGGLSPAGIKRKDGSLWFPTQDGVAMIEPARLAPVPPPPPVIVESCLIDHKPVAVERTIRLTPEYDNLEIQYTALSFINSEQIRFRYRLGGLNRDWVEAGTRRAAYYAHLPPGSYTFSVTAAHSGGGWNEASANLAIVVLPRFYQTWWFALLWSSSAAGAIWLGWRYKTSRLERDRVAQQVFSRQLIASQENERKRISAELHDSLGQRLVVIKNRALLLMRTHDNAPSLNSAQRAQMEEISSEISEAMREVKEISYDLRPYRLDRLGLTTALRALVQTAATSASTRFEAEIDEIDGVLPDQSEINFYRIVQECVNNILKHSQASEASIRIRRAGERLELIVSDDGQGFTPEARRDSSQGGFGLMGISERAQLLGGKAAIHSAPGQGTTVTIEIDSGS